MACISIIVPVYNVEKYISRCVESILSQSFQDWELILVDDGSSDTSGFICNDYASNDIRIHSYHKKNGGVSTARNFGLDNAKGDYVTFIDSDDTFMPNALEQMLKRMREDVCLSFSNLSIIRNSGVVDLTGKKDSGEYSIESMLSWLLTGKPCYIGYICCKLYKRSLIEQFKIRFDTDIKFNEDRLFCLSYLCCCNGIVSYTDETVYKYFELNGGAIASLNKGFNPYITTDLIAFLKMIGILKSSGYHRLVALAERQAYKSYYRICRDLNRYRVNDSEIRNSIKNRLVSVIGKYSFYKYCLYNIFDMVETKLEQMVKK